MSRIARRLVSYRASDPLRRVLAGANPVAVDRIASLAPEPALDAIRGGIVRSGRVATRRRGFRKARLGVLLAAAAMFVTTAGASFYVGVHTGIFGNPNTTEEDGSEWLNANSPEILQVIDHDTAKYPLPPGGSWSAFRAGWPTAQPMRLQATGIEGGVAWESFCQWRGYWLAGYQSQNATQMAAAQAMLDQIPNWPIMRNPKAFDPNSAQPMQRTVVELARTKNGAEFKRLYMLQCASANR